MKNIIFIGSEFYWKSSTIMSSIYEIIDDYLVRSDWGQVQVALQKGEEVHIRPATDAEMVWAYKKLGEWEEKYGRK